MKQPLFVAVFFVAVALSLKSSLGVPHSAPTAGIAVTPFSFPREMGELVGTNGVRNGYSGFIPPADPNTPPDVYLNFTYQDLLGVLEYDTYKTDKITGTRTVVQTWNVNGQITSTNFTFAGGYDDSNVEGDFPDNTNTITCSETNVEYRSTYPDSTDYNASYNESVDTLYTPQEFKTNVESRVPAFSNNFTRYTGQGYFEDFASRYLSQDQITYQLNKLQYKWNVNPITNQIVIWNEVFWPTDGNNPTMIKTLSWTNTTGTNVSPTYLIDPAHYTNSDGTLQTNNGVWVVRNPYILSLYQANYPNSTNATDVGDREWVTIPDQGSNTTVYITGEPAMPDLWINYYDANYTTNIINVSWYMHVTSERPERGTQDDVRIPASGYVTNPTYNFFEITTNYYGTNFFGGVATLYLTLQDTNGTNLAPEVTYTFKIRGKNPTDANAKMYIQQQDGTNYPFAWAIAQYESRQSHRGNTIYNQFNSTEGVPELPNYSADGKNGWGIFQRDDTHGGIYVDTAQVYNWKTNTQVALQELASKQQLALSYFHAVHRTYRSKYESPPDTNTVWGMKGDPATSTTLTALQAAIITLYNVSPVTARLQTGETNADGSLDYDTYSSCWAFDPNAPSGHRWTYKTNTNNYVFKVIYNEYEGHDTNAVSE